MFKCYVFLLKRKENVDEEVIGYCQLLFEI
jgi:hypothetical protein